MWVNFASDGSLTVPIYAGFPVDGTKSWEHPTCQLDLNLPAGFEDGKLTFEITEDSMCLVHEHKARESAPKRCFCRVFSHAHWVQAIPNSCCNDKTAYDGPDILNPYFNPSAQRTGDTLIGLISEPGPASPFPISGNNADTSFDQILAPLLASGSNAPNTYEDAWRDTPEQFGYIE